MTRLYCFRTGKTLKNFSRCSTRCMNPFYLHNWGRRKQPLTFPGSLLVGNGYPRSVVDEHVSKTFTKFKPRPTRDQRFPLCIKLPWIDNKSITFEQQIKKAVRACFDDAEVRTSYTTRPLISITINHSIPIILKNKIVYLFKCLRGEWEKPSRDSWRRSYNAGRGESFPGTNRQKSAIEKHLCESKDWREAYDES